MKKNILTAQREAGAWARSGTLSWAGDHRGRRGQDRGAGGAGTTEWGVARDGGPGGAGTTEESVARDRGPRGHWDQDGGVAWDGGTGVGGPPERVLLRARRPERWSVHSQVTF